MIDKWIWLVINEQKVFENPKTYLGGVLNTSKMGDLISTKGFGERWFHPSWMNFVHYGWKKVHRLYIEELCIQDLLFVQLHN
jgi:hypothetical protein